MQLKIEGMMCAHCAARVEKVLADLGATDIKVSVENGTADFNGDKEISMYAAAVEDVGYDVKK